MLVGPVSRLSISSLLIGQKRVHVTSKKSEESGQLLNTPKTVDALSPYLLKGQVCVRQMSSQLLMM